VPEAGKARIAGFPAEDSHAAHPDAARGARHPARFAPARPGRDRAARRIPATPRSRPDPPGDKTTEGLTQMVETLNPPSGRKPVLGLAGFFGYGNYGDELFVSVYKQFLSERFDLKILTDQLYKPYYARPIEEIVAEVDAILIGGGDIVQPWGMDVRYFSKAFLAKPVFVVGVGVPIRAASTGNTNQVEKDWIVEKYRTFFSHPSVKMIHARDPQSVRWIEDRLTPDREVIEAPDIVCALDLPPAPRPEGAPILGIVTRQRPAKADDYTHINALARQQAARGWRIRHIVLGTGDVGEKDVENAAEIAVDKELVQSQSLDDLTRAIGECTALVSMKFHGTVVATMYGVPSTVLIPTNKNRNFMQRIGREDLLSRFDDPSLSERFSPEPPAPIDAESVAMLRRRAGDLMRRLETEIAAALG
jgi:polysaccharide pyruvyl transferase WcaK-like protein